MFEDISPYIKEVNKILNFDYFKTLQLLNNGEVGKEQYKKIMTDYFNKINELVTNDNKIIVSITEYLNPTDIIKNDSFSDMTFVTSKNNTCIETIRRYIREKQYNQTEYFTITLNNY